GPGPARPPPAAWRGPGTRAGGTRGRPARPPRPGPRKHGRPPAGARSPSSAPAGGRRAARTGDSGPAPPRPAGGFADRPGTSRGPAAGGTRPSCNPCPCNGRGSSSWRSQVLAVADLLHDPPDALVAVDRVQQVLGGDGR